jgi:hypothetical protein
MIKNDKLFCDGLEFLDYEFRKMVLEGRIKVKKRDIMNLSPKKPPHKIQNLDELIKALE